MFSEVLDPNSTDDLALAGLPGSGPGFARAAQNDAGFGGVEARAVWFSGNGFNRLTAFSSFSETVTNTSGGPLTYFYDFFITAPMLAISDFAGLSDADPLAMDSSYVIEITLNGMQVFFSQAELYGGFVSHAFVEVGTDLGGTLFGEGPPGPESENVFGYNFDPFAGSLDLGMFADGESFTVAYTLLAQVSGPGFETGAAARIGDPGDLGAAGLSGTIRSSGTSTPQIPEPGTLSLLGLGLAGLAVIRRKAARRES